MTGQLTYCWPMLTLKQIQNIYAYAEPQNQKARLQLVEYVQYELLDSLFKQEGSEFLNFIGGMAIRIAYGGNRFSEDLDFDNFGLSPEAFQKLLKAVVADMKIKGFETEFRLVDENTFHCYIHCPKLLRGNALGSNGDEKILVRINANLKDEKITPKIFLLEKFELYRNIRVNPISIILSQKLVAIKERKREKGRDFYDASFLYGLADPDFGYIEKTLGLDPKQFAEAIIERCGELDFKILAKDIEPFLIKTDQIARVETFPEFIRTKLALPKAAFGINKNQKSNIKNKWDQFKLINHVF